MNTDTLQPEGAQAAQFYSFTEEQQQLRKEIRDFAARENCSQCNALGRDQRISPRTW